MFKKTVFGELQETKRRRADLLDQCRAILDKAEIEKRGLTEEEKRQHDRLMVDVKKDSETIRDLEENVERERAEAERAASRGRASEGPRFLDADGNEVRALLPTERLADVVRRELLPDGLRAEDLSVGRFVRAVITGDWRGAEAEKRAMATFDSTLGGYLVPSPLSSRVIDLARNQARVIQAGALTIPMDAPTLKLAKVLQDPTAHWVGEHAAATVSDMQFGALNMSARKLVALCKLSVELIEDAPNIGQVVERALASALALELDRASLYGDDAAEPAGIRGATGVQILDLATNGRALNGFDDFSKAWQLIQQVNGPSEGISVLYAARTAGELDRQKDGEGQPLRPPASWDMMKKFVTNQVPTNLTHGSANNATEAFVGVFAELLIGLRTDLRLEISREAADSNSSAFTHGQVWIRAYLRADSAPMRPDHFVVLSGITPGE
jgi:HK97 family phage major capsid protein